MSHRKVIDNYYVDICNLADLLTKLVSSYRLLIGGADELNKIALATKGQVKAAIKRACKLGEVIDDLIDALDDTEYNYINYCKIKADIVELQVLYNNIETEIDNELKLKD